MAVSTRLFADNYLGRYRGIQRLAERRIEAAALLATDRMARAGLARIRQDMAGAGLGRLGNALGATSDLAQGRGVHRRGGGWSASGVIFLRSKSPRTIGAMVSYTQGAEITPVRSRWLWIPTDAIPRVTGRYRMTPALWQKNGFNTKIGPLVRIKGPKDNPLLIVRQVGVNAAGKSRSAKSLTKRGLPRKGQVRRDFIVAFVGIPRTSRRARVNLTTIVQNEMQQMPQFFRQAMERTFR